MMIIKSKHSSFKVEHATQFLKHVRGLMFKFPKNEGILFEFKQEKKVALHTCFVFFKIDLVYLNNNKKVIKIRRGVLPFIPYIPKVKCKYILELKNCKKLKIKEKLKF